MAKVPVTPKKVKLFVKLAEHAEALLTFFLQNSHGFVRVKSQKSADVILTDDNALEASGKKLILFPSMSANEAEAEDPLEFACLSLPGIQARIRRMKIEASTTMPEHQPQGLRRSTRRKQQGELIALAG